MSELDLTPYRRIVAWRSFLGPVASWAIIAAMVSLCVEISWGFYPLSALVIANRQLALILYGHEGIHHSLLAHRGWNDRAARFLLFFPHFISLSRYRMKHLLHHRFLGTRLDPDLGLYSSYPYGGRRIAQVLARFFSGGMVADFMDYYTEIPVVLKGGRRSLDENSVFGKSDLVSYLLFQVAWIGFFVFMGWGLPFLLLWVLPLVFALPYHYFIGGLQHGTLLEKSETELKSRNVVGAKWLMEILLPADIKSA